MGIKKIFEVSQSNPLTPKYSICDHIVFKCYNQAIHRAIGKEKYKKQGNTENKIQLPVFLYTLDRITIFPVSHLPWCCHRFNHWNPPFPFFPYNHIGTGTSKVSGQRKLTNVNKIYYALLPYRMERGNAADYHIFVLYIHGIWYDLFHFILLLFLFLTIRSMCIKLNV